MDPALGVSGGTIVSHITELGIVEQDAGGVRMRSET